MKLQQVIVRLQRNLGGVAQPVTSSASQLSKLTRDPSEKDCAKASLAALLMLQVQMSAAHEGKFIKASSLARTAQELAIHHSNTLHVSPLL